MARMEKGPGCSGTTLCQDAENSKVGEHPTVGLEKTQVTIAHSTLYSEISNALVCTYLGINLCSPIQEPKAGTQPVGGKSNSMLYHISLRV